MKNISSSMKDYIKQSTVVIAVLILIERVDGVIQGFTDWDVSITYNGHTYVPAIAMAPSSLKTNADLTTDQMDITAAIDSQYILEADIDGGRYDGATVTVVKVNPNDLTMGAIHQTSATVGQIDYGELNFTSAINSIGQYLNQSIGDIVTPSCRCKQLGDFQCKVNISSFRFAATVYSVTDQRTLVFTDSNPSDYYDYGMVRFNSYVGGGGLNYGINAEVKISTYDSGTGKVTIVLQEPLPFPVVAGDAVVLEAGCDRKPKTCREKFNNLVNIHCEPYVPGNDYLLQVGRPPS